MLLNHKQQTTQAQKSNTPKRGCNVPVLLNSKRICGPSIVQAAATSVSTLPEAKQSSQHGAQQRGPLTTLELSQLYKDFLKGVQTSLYVEHAYRITPDMVEGTIPKDLQGTLLRNGPAIFEVGERKIAQPFDGDGMICTFAFKDGEAYFRNKLVRTEGLIKEQRAGKPLYRSAFNKGLPDGALFNNPLDLSIKDPANTHVVHWGGKLLALYERGKPHYLNEQLVTQGQFEPPGMNGFPYFAAHHRIVRNSRTGEQRLVGFGAMEDGFNAKLQVWEFDEAFNCLSSTPVSIPDAAFGFFHDFAVTDTYYVFLENPIRLNVWRMLTRYTTGDACVAECLDFTPAAKVKVHLIPRPGAPASAQRRTVAVQGDPFFTFHMSNAYDVAASGTGATHVVVDACSAQYVDLGFSVEKPMSDYYADTRQAYRYGRIVVDLQADTAVRHQGGMLNSELPTVAPAMVGQPHTHTYMYGAVTDMQFLPPQATVKYSVPPLMGVTEPWDAARITRETWAPGQRMIAQEPVFVPRSGGSGAEDDGYLLAVVLDTAVMKSQLVILDAARLSAGPLATLRLPHHVPLGLHGGFTPAVLGMSTQDESPFDIRTGI